MHDPHLLKLFKQSETALYPQGRYKNPQWVMRMDAEQFPKPPSTTPLALHPVRARADRERLYELRREVEARFGITEPAQVRTLIEEIQGHCTHHRAQWYILEKRDAFTSSDSACARTRRIGPRFGTRGTGFEKSASSRPLRPIP